MKIVIDRQKIVEAVSLPQSIADKKSGRIADLLIEAREEGIVNFTGTDLDTFITTSSEAKVEESGKICVNAKKFYEVTRELPGEEIEITTTDSKLKIKSGNSQFHLVTSDPEDFPVKPTFDSSGEIILPSETLSDLIESTLFAAATDDIRPVLGGILLEKNEENLIAVATDSHRLSYLSIKIEGIQEIDFPDKGVIIPRKGASELNKLCSKGEEIKLKISDSVITASNGNTEITLRLIMGEYPNYKSVIPYDNPMTAEVTREEFTSAVKRVSLISTEKLRGVKLIFSQDKLKLVSRDDLGDAEETISARLDGDPIEIGFNAKYLLECTNPFNKEKLFFKLRDEMTATLIYDDPSMKRFVIIMPMNIQW